MLVLRPAALQLNFSCAEDERCQTQQHNGPARMEIAEKDGVKFRQVVKALREHWHERAASPIYSDGPSRWEFFGHDYVLCLSRDVTGWEVIEKMREVAAT